MKSQQGLQYFFSVFCLFVFLLNPKFRMHVTKFLHDCFFPKENLRFQTLNMRLNVLVLICPPVVGRAANRQIRLFRAPFFSQLNYYYFIIISLFRDSVIYSVDLYRSTTGQCHVLLISDVVNKFVNKLLVNTRYQGYFFFNENCWLVLPKIVLVLRGGEK